MADVIAAAFASVGCLLIAVAVVRGRRFKRRQWRDRPRLPSFITKD